MNYVLTDRGIQYLTRVNSQIINMHLLRAEVSSEMSNTPELLTQITGKKQGMQIDEISAETDIATIHCTLSNLEVHEEYMLRQIGIVAWDAERKREELVIVGQDEEGDRIPAIEEREVQYLYNIGVKISNTENITFDSDTNDFLRKKYFYAFVDELYKRGKVTIGTKDTEIEDNEICIVVDDMPYTEENIETKVGIWSKDGKRADVTTANGHDIGIINEEEEA